MKTVYLVRHAKSSWKDMSLDDIDRPLNKRGLRDAPFMGTLLKGRGVEPDRLLSSPARRALDTARHFARAFGREESEVDVRNELYGAGSEDIMRLIRSLDEALATVLLFGHNPTLTTLANRFAGQRIANVPTCGIVQLECPAAEWSGFSRDKARLTAFFYPKQYFT